MKQITFVLWCGSKFGGLERRYLRLAGELAKRPSLSIRVVCQQRSRRPTEEILKDCSAEIIVIASKIPRLNHLVKFTRLLELIHLAYFLKRSGPGDVVACGNPGLLSFFLALVKNHKQKLIVANAMLLSDLPLPFWHRVCVPVVANKAATIDNLSEEPSKALRSFLSVEKIRACETFAPCSFSDYSQAVISPNRDIDILMLARFVDGKGYDLLEELDEELAGLNFHVCGFGSRKISLKSASVYTTDAPYEVLAQTKIFLSLQKTNNYPSQSLLEAMASGCAIIATDVGETRRLLDETRSILIPYDAVYLKSAIEKLMNDQALRLQLGKAARVHVTKTQTVERYAEYFLRDVVQIQIK